MLSIGFSVHHSIPATMLLFHNSAMYSSPKLVVKYFTMPDFAGKKSLGSLKDRSEKTW